ncbi:cupin [Amycolatopsis keratiniphila subsp. keratiniphila]|uniref:Cupin n=2 Tax=Amycolatopsis keratiniphila TaxID=129921 RepID=A0A1W2LZI3_9PSEU|nr:cupin [Amycolatopsis keratiniphila subsp. keratiniphila]
MGAGLGISAFTTAGTSTATTSYPRSDQTMNHPHLFNLADSPATVVEGGSLRGAHEQNFPVLKGQNGSVYLIRLDVGGVREPHWHPTAWELNYVISGKVKWTILGTHPDGSYHRDTFDAGQGDLVFAPQGFFHYFENLSETEPLDVLVIFNSSTQEPNDDIGIVGTFNSMPREVLAACFGVPAAAFDQIPREIKPVVITRRHK